MSVLGWASDTSCTPLQTTTTHHALELLLGVVFVVALVHPHELHLVLQHAPARAPVPGYAGWAVGG